MVVLNFTNKKTCLEKSQEHPQAEVILPPRQYTLEEIEDEILKKSSLGINSLKSATEAIKGVYLYMTNCKICIPIIIFMNSRLF